MAIIIARSGGDFIAMPSRAWSCTTPMRQFTVTIPFLARLDRSICEINHPYEENVGRVCQRYTWPELVELYRLPQVARSHRPRYDILPDRHYLRDGKKALRHLPATFSIRVETA